ncbi:MAG: valyl-tRNA synthetase [Parcubacteria bacterium C7867-003]|nr:MAG: valyl-tRNA synthetase [Parcubacteria bacterium C7867-003]
MKDVFLSPYDPKETETRIYQIWKDSGFFNPDTLVEKGIINSEAKPFTIIMPPTNANGSLHAGHGLVMTIEDIMVRYKRMQGFKTLWLPGLDHAGFETQVVYEKKLEKEGRSRFGMDPKDLYKEILDFTLTNSTNIKSQIAKIGASCDWSREKFTLDDDVVKTVHGTFKRMFDDGLIYRGNRIVSWCSKHQTSFSDLEINNEDRVEKLYYLKYGPFTIATSRPETKFGDKYVVMHPEDKRYSEYKDGQKIKLEWINGEIEATVIKDSAIEMEFGTGVMTITPWHDNTDFEIAQRHNLEKEQIINEFGKLLPIAGEFEGMPISKARPLIIEKLQNKGLVEKIEENYKHIVRTCYKCGTVIEPQIKSQWFIKMKPLAEKALEKIQNDEIVYLPEHYKKITINWLENIRDWNIFS